MKDRRDQLREVLAEIERRARLSGILFSLNPFPGEKRDFVRILQTLVLAYALRGVATIEDDLHAVGVKFRPRRGGQDPSLKRLFPEIFGDR
jgi:hypothetical protein